MIFSIVAAATLGITQASTPSCAIRLELNASMVVPYQFRPNESVQVTATGNVTWYKHRAKQIESGPDGTKLDRVALRNEVGLLGYLYPPLVSANDGALLSSTDAGLALVGAKKQVKVGKTGLLKLRVNDAWGVDNSGVYVVTIGSEPPAPEKDIANTIEKGKGIVAFDFRKRYGNYMWSEHRDASKGHQYLTAISIGRLKMTPEEANTLLRKRVRDVFPGTASGKNGNEVTPGNIFTLVVNLNVVLPKVITKRVTPYSFTFEALPGHALRGTATHGIFKDSTGEFYLFQQGRGVPNEPISQQITNLDIAPTMWKAMAGKLRRLLMRDIA